MGGFGSGHRGGGGPTIESEFAFRIDIDALRRDGLIRLGALAASSGFPTPVATAMSNAKLISVVPGTTGFA